MGRYASKVVAQAREWIGKNESNGTHKSIIDLYNSHKPLARGYAVKYTDEWCATFVSAVAIKLGYTDIIPTECGCEEQVKLFKKIGAWDENDNRTPRPGDIVYYDWADTGKGDNTGYTDHVGIVEKVSGNTITVIEGNYGNAVKRRTLSVGARYIRGYGVPKYDTETADSTSNAEPVKETVKETAPLTSTLSFKLPQISYGCTGMAVKMLQTFLGVSADGDFGNITKTALVKFQKEAGIDADGICGKDTWTKVAGKMRANTYK